MSRGKRKGGISAEQRKEWLRRSQSGESIPRIAAAEGYDPRTVRKYVLMAREEDETGEAKHRVLYDALREHYKALCSVAAKLESAVSTPYGHAVPGFSSAYAGHEGRLFQALRQHLPNSPLWKAVDRWEALVAERALLRSVIESKVLRRAEEALGASVSKSESLGTFFADSLDLHATQLAEGQKWTLSLPYTVTKADGGRVLVQVGGSSATVPEAMTENVVKAHQELRGQLSVWDEVEQLRRGVQEFSGLREKIVDEAAAIQLKGVVPGKCRYCPF